MSIKLHYEGVLVECDTPAQAIEILRSLTAPTPNLNGQPEAQRDMSIPVFVTGLGERQRQALRIILGAGGSTTDAVLREELGVDSSGLGGLMSAITKRAEAAHFNVERLLRNEIAIGANNERIRRYSIPREAQADVEEALAA